MAARDRLEELPPSAKLIHKVLEYDGPLTQKRLIEETNLSPRTVRYALDRLDDCDCIEEQVYVKDARQRLYRLASPVDDTAEESEAEVA
ncbi:MAG: winged helix-turn-helix transcriptional regulator [Halodesulfurarchaeum sp.]